MMHGTMSLKWTVSVLSVLLTQRRRQRLRLYQMKMYAFPNVITGSLLKQSCRQCPKNWWSGTSFIVRHGDEQHTKLQYVKRDVRYKSACCRLFARIVTTILIDDSALSVAAFAIATWRSFGGIRKITRFWNIRATEVTMQRKPVSVALHFLGIWFCR